MFENYLIFYDNFLPWHYLKKYKHRKQVICSPKIIGKFYEKHVYVLRYRGGGGSPRSNPYFKAKPKLSVFENGQFSGHFFFDQKFFKKCKMLWGKSFGIFFDTQKKFFFRTLFGA